MSTDRRVLRRELVRMGRLGRLPAAGKAGLRGRTVNDQGPVPPSFQTVTRAATTLRAADRLQARTILEVGGRLLDAVLAERRVSVDGWGPTVGGGGHLGSHRRGGRPTQLRRPARVRLGGVGSRRRFGGDLVRGGPPGPAGVAGATGGRTGERERTAGPTRQPDRAVDAIRDRFGSSAIGMATLVDDDPLSPKVRGEQAWGPDRDGATRSDAGRSEGPTDGDREGGDRLDPG